MTQFEKERGLSVPKTAGQRGRSKTVKHRRGGFVEAARFQGGQFFAVATIEWCHYRNAANSYICYDESVP